MIRISLAFSLFLALFLIFDATGLVGNHYVFSDPTLRGIYKVVSGLSAALAWVVAAWLLKSGLDPQEKPNHTRMLFRLVLAALLVLCVAAVTFRHGILVQATGRAPEDNFPAVLRLGRWNAILRTLFRHPNTFERWSGAGRRLDV
jgi:hypothetical protein